MEGEHAKKIARAVAEEHQVFRGSLVSMEDGEVVTQFTPARLTPIDDTLEVVDGELSPKRVRRFLWGKKEHPFIQRAGTCVFSMTDGDGAVHLGLCERLPAIPVVEEIRA